MSKFRRNVRKRAQKNRRRIRQRLAKVLGNKELIIDGNEMPVKMSEVLKAFIAPYKHLATTDQAYETLVITAIAAWNLALMPVEKRATAMEEVIQTLKTPQYADEARESLQMLIDDKLARFPDIQRFIVDYELEDSGDSYHLSVVSTVSPDEAT